MKGVERVFHVAGTTSMRSRDREPRLRGQRRGDPQRHGGGAARRRRARRAHLELERGRAPRGRGRPSTRTTRSPWAVSGSPTSTPSTRPSWSRCASAAKGLPVVIVNPSFVLGPRGSEPERDLQRAGAPAPAAPHPRLPRRSDQHRRRPRRRQRATSSPTSAARRGSATCSPAGTSRSSGSSPTSAGSPGCRPLRSGCRDGWRWRASRRWSWSDCACRPPRTRCAPGSQWFTYRNDKAREKLGWEPRPHEETLEDTVAGSSRSSASGPRATGSPTSRCAAPAAPCDCFPSADDRAAARPLPLPRPDQLPLPLRRGRAAG